MPILTEMDLRDLYGWARILVDLALRSPTIRPLPPDSLLEGTNGEDYPGRITRLFHAASLLNENHELRHAIANLAERTLTIRIAEARVDPSAVNALTLMEEDYRAARWADLRRKNMHFHRRRIASAARVLAELRPRAQPLG